MSPSLIAARLKRRRLALGWTQADLAGAAGVSRAAVSAVELGRLTPSVSAALALASALGCTVEALFGPEPAAEWAISPAGDCRYWRAEVGGRVLHYPAATGPAHDGMFSEGEYAPRRADDPSETMVVASCDPAAGLLAAEYARQTGLRLLVLSRSSGAALALLRDGLVHAAGLHFATPAEPDLNADAVRHELGNGYDLLAVADWQEGLAFAPGRGRATVGEATRAALRWVGREEGSAARRCLDELRPGLPPPSRSARDHRDVAAALGNGWADAGVCPRLVADEAGLPFLGVRSEMFDLCYPAASAADPRLAALARVVGSKAYRRLVADLPGFDPARAGELRPAA